MRTETSSTSWSYTSTPVTGSYGKLTREAEDIMDDMMDAFREGRYAEALAKAQYLETMCDGFVERAEFALEHFLKGQFAETRAYFMALQQNPEAIALCDAGFEKLKAASDALLSLAYDAGFDNARDFYNDMLPHLHLFYRGFIELSVGQRAQAVADLKTAFEPLFFDKAAPIEALFLGKILEQKLRTQLLPVPPSIDPTDAMSLFKAGRYEEALALIPEHPTSDSKFEWGWWERQRQESRDNALKGACLALLGRTSEALAVFEDNSSDYCDTSETMRSLTYLQADQFTKARASCLNALDDDFEQFLIPMPILCRDTEEFVRHLIPLAIRGFENSN